MAMMVIELYRIPTIYNIKSIRMLFQLDFKNCIDRLKITSLSYKNNL